MCDTIHGDYLPHTTFRFYVIDFQLNSDIGFPFPILHF